MDQFFIYLVQIIIPYNWKQNKFGRNEWTIFCQKDELSPTEPTLGIKLRLTVRAETTKQTRCGEPKASRARMGFCQDVGVFMSLVCNFSTAELYVYMDGITRG